MADDKIEAEQILNRFAGNADGMAAYLLKIAPTKSSVIYWVFELVNHQTAGRSKKPPLRPVSVT